MSSSMPNNRTQETLAVRDFYESFRDALELELVCGESGLDKTIREKSINRPSLVLTGYYKYFAAKRIQLFGAGEMGYLRDLEIGMQSRRLHGMLEKNIPCMIVSRQLVPTRSMLDAAKQFNVPLFRTPLKSKTFTTEATLLLEEKLAPRTVVHGTLLDIKGIGTMLQGKSGVGKSECALALIERGYSLVADDLTYVHMMSDRVLVGNSSELNRGYMECRGIGIINVGDLFGIRSVRIQKRIDLIVRFLEWKPGMHEERTGLEESFETILGITVPLVEIPVRPGRDLARLVEVAAMVQAAKQMGHDSAKEFNERLIAHMTSDSA